MRKVLCLLTAALLISGVSAQVWKNVLTGVTVSAINADKQVQQVTKQVNRPIQTLNLGNSSTTKTSIQSAIDLNNMIAVDVRQYFDGKTFISFTFSNGMAKTSLEDGTLSTLIPLSYAAKDAEPGEKVYKGQSKLGHGLYYFSQDKTRLRIVLDTQDTLIFKGLAPLRPLKL